MARNWKCNVDTDGTPCGNKAIIKAGRGKTARFFCKEHEIVAVGLILAGEI